jgi:hypothetical protein
MPRGFMWQASLGPGRQHHQHGMALMLAAQSPKLRSYRSRARLALRLRMGVRFMPTPD